MQMSSNYPINNTFHADDQRSWDIYEKFYVHFFKKYSLHGEFASIRPSPSQGKKTTISDKLVIALQKQGVDVANLCMRTGNTLFWDIKSDWHPPKNFCFETFSNTMRAPWTPGWMCNSKAHKILYGFALDANTVDAYALDNSKLQEWFWPIHRNYHFDRVRNTPNRSGFHLVPVEDVVKNIPTRHYRITSDGEVTHIPRLEVVK